MSDSPPERSTESTANRSPAGSVQLSMPIAPLTFGEAEGQWEIVTGVSRV
jgi:hypothetical protein